MRRKRWEIIGVGLALLVGLAMVWAATGYAGPDCATGAKKAAAGGCPAAKAGACPSAKAGACPSATKGAQAAGVGCAGATVPAAGSLSLPEGTRMTRMDVENGIDLVFTGKDLAAVRARLDEHIAACAGMKEKPCGTQTCTVATTENSVVLSVRGPNAESCCTMMAACLSGDEAKSEPAKPAKKKGSWWKRS